jgi:hypothetical protein
MHRFYEAKLGNRHLAVNPDRAVFSSRSDRRSLHVLSIDGVVAMATATSDSAVTVQLASGQTATIEFVHDDIGAKLTYAGATTALAPGFDPLPE